MPTNKLFWSILSTIAVAIFLFTLFAAARQTPESANNQPKELAAINSDVEFHLRCMKRSFNFTCHPWEISCDEPHYIGCVISHDEIQYRYEKTGWLSEDYVEALKIYHNYNQTDVDIDICKLSQRRCPDRIKALNARCSSTDIKSGRPGNFCCRPRDIELGRHGC